MNVNSISLKDSKQATPGDFIITNKREVFYIVDTTDNLDNEDFPIKIIDIQNNVIIEGLLEDDYLEIGDGLPALGGQVVQIIPGNEMYIERRER